MYSLLKSQNWHCKIVGVSRGDSISSEKYIISFVTFNAVFVLYLVSACIFQSKPTRCPDEISNHDSDFIHKTVLKIEQEYFYKGGFWQF